MQYGMPYIGSKNQLAKHIFAVLPRGERFVELFGGGGAMTHYASVNGLYSKFLYNEINPLVCQLFRDALDGRYAYENFHPQWVTREQFHREKATNGYIACVWSFCNNFRSYLYTDSPLNREVFEWIVNGTTPTFCDSQTLKALQECTETDIHERRLYLTRLCKKLRCHSIENIEKMQALQNIDRLGRMKTVGGGA